MHRPNLLLMIMAIAFSQSEIMSPSPIKGVMFPLFFFAALLILLIWLVRRFHSNREGDGDRGIQVVFFFGGGKNSDANSGGDGGGGD